MVRARLVGCGLLALGLLFGAPLAGCGPKAPTHNGYKTKTPWKKAKPITLDDKLEAKVKGELDYGEYKRAKWYSLDVPEDGQLALALQFTPTDDAGDATVAMEVLDANFRVISEDEDAPVEEAPAAKGKAPDDEDADADDDEDEDADDDGGDDSSGGDTQKSRQLPGLAPGRYYVHLFVTKRLDAAEFELNVGFTPVAKPSESTFPREVAFLPVLPVVPLEDDAPVVPDKKCTGKKCGGGKKGGGGGKPDKPDKEPEDKPVSTGTVQAIVIDAKATSGGTEITISVGTNGGVDAGRKGSIGGLKNGSFTITSCSDKSCKATVKATIDEVNKSSRAVTIK